MNNDEEYTTDELSKIFGFKNNANNVIDLEDEMDAEMSPSPPKRQKKDPLILALSSTIESSKEKKVLLLGRIPIKNLSILVPPLSSTSEEFFTIYVGSLKGKLI